MNAVIGKLNEFGYVQLTTTSRTLILEDRGLLAKLLKTDPADLEGRSIHLTYDNQGSLVGARLSGE